MSAQPSPETAAPQGVTQVAELIARSAERIVMSPQFSDILAEKIAARLRPAGYLHAVPLHELDHGLVIVPPQPTELGNVLVLTQAALQGGQNVCLSVLAKDFTLVDQPRVEGQELDNYTMVTYVDGLLPGEIRGRKLFNFQETGDSQLEGELARQLATLKLGQCAFFYLNILRNRPGEQGAAA